MENQLEARCMKCRKQVLMSKALISKAHNGMWMAKGVCPECDTKVCRILGRNYQSE